MAGEAFGLKPFTRTNTDACPDCRADVELREAYPGIWNLNIAHDDTCPAYRAIRERTTS